MLYEIYPVLQVVDILCSVMMVVGIFCFVARKKLKGFEEDGSKLLHAIYICNMVSVVLYNFLVCTILGSPFTDAIGGFLGSLLGFGVTLWCSIVYFNKRSYLFVN